MGVTFENLTQMLIEVVSDFDIEIIEPPEGEGHVTQLVVEVVSDFDERPPPEPPRIARVDPCASAAMFLSEYDSYISPDGVEYRLHAPDIRWVLSDEGSGMPPIEYVSVRGAYQDGETLVDRHLRPRVVQLLIRQNFKDRSAYWTGRMALLDALRPNRQLPGEKIRLGKLRKYVASGSLLDLDCLIERGPGFKSRDRDVWDEFAIQEVIRFIAFDPIYYNPHQECILFSFDAATAAACAAAQVFPVTYCGAFDEPLTFDYTGTWEEYPTFAITGPASNIRIENQNHEHSILLNYTIPNGVVVDIDLRYGQKSIVRRDNGDNLIGFLSNDSDFGTWALHPGENILRVSANATALQTQAQLCYYKRYVGY